MADQALMPRPETRPPAQETGGEIPAAETAPETVVEAPALEQRTAEQVAETAAAEQFEAQRPGGPPPTPASAPAPSKDPVLKEVEQVLEAGLEEAYQSMDPGRRAAFRARGEQVAGRIRAMVVRGKLKLQDVWKLIADWLRMIPGVNRFFVEQEAKIKTDRIMHLAEKQKGK